MVVLTPEEIKYQQDHINDNLQPNIYAACLVCLVAAYLAVVLRFAARRLNHSALGKDDYTIVIALFFTSSFEAMCIFVTHYGMGKHAILLKPDAVVPFVKGTLAAEVLYNPAIFTTKLSILLLYHRIFPGRTFTIILWCVGTFVLAYSITAAAVNIFQCVPVESLWNPAITPRCVNLSVELIILSSINVVTDVVILCLPMPILWRLHVSQTRKIQLSGMFLLGGVVCIVSIIRATYVSSVSLTDGTWNNTYGAIWSVVETCIAVVSACLPTLRPLYNRVVRGDVNAGSAKDRYATSNKGDASQPSGYKPSGSSGGTKLTTLKSGKVQIHHVGGGEAAGRQRERDAETGSFVRLRDEGGWYDHEGDRRGGRI